MLAPCSLSERTWIEKLIILASAAPIAVLANVIRISTTAILYKLGGVDLGNKRVSRPGRLVHDALAVVLLWIVLWILDQMLITPEVKKPLVVRL